MRAVGRQRERYRFGCAGAAHRPQTLVIVYRYLHQEVVTVSPQITGIQQCSWRLEMSDHNRFTTRIGRTISVERGWEIGAAGRSAKPETAIPVDGQLADVFETGTAEQRGVIYLVRLGQTHQVTI